MVRVKVSLFRYCDILPDPLIAEFCRKKITGITFPNLPDRPIPWNVWERDLELEFDGEKSSSLDTVLMCAAGACKYCGGQCCKRLPEHNIRIYATIFETEQIAKHIKKNYGDFTFGYIEVPDEFGDATLFNIISVKKNGDCILLGPNGCLAGECKPLWCKMYYCERFQGGRYQFEHLEKGE